MEADGLDLTSDPGGAPERGGEAWPFVGVNFTCCGVYARIYRTHDAAAYAGACPRCCKPIRLRIGPGGVSARFFTAQ